MDFMLDDDLPFTSQTTQEREIVPAGIHTMTIVNVEEGPNEYKRSDDNPDGLCIKLRLSTGTYKFVFDDIPKHLAWRAKQLAEAVGILPVGGKLSLTPDDLADKTVTVEVSHYTSKAGKVSAVVKRYVPTTAAPAAATPAKRQTLPQKAHAAFKASAGSDDIPFAWLMVALVASVLGGGA
jgi:cell division septation protein DedD